MIFDAIYNVTIYPIEFIIETLFYLFTNILKYSYPASLFLLSLSITILSLPLYMIAEKWKKEEENIQARMKPDIEHIKKTFKGDERFLLIQACYRIYGYKTIYAFRGTLGLLIQIPFFLAAYNFIHNLNVLNGVQLLLIKDLSKPDALINIGNISINLLPFIMTLFSLLSGLVYAKKGNFKENIPVYVIPLIFLVLLYTSPSGLLFYWTINCLFSLIKNIVIKYKLLNISYFISKDNRVKIIGIYKNTIIIISIIFLAVFVYANIFKDSVSINNSFILLVLLSIFSVIYILISNYNFIKRIIYIYKIKLKNILLILIMLLTFYVLILSVSGLVNERLILILSIFSVIYILISNYNFIKKMIPLYKAKCCKIYTVLILLLTISILVLYILGFVSRKGFLDGFNLVSENSHQYIYNIRLSYYDKIFRNSDIYGVKVNTKDLDNRILNIEFQKNGSPYGIMTLNTPIRYMGKIEVYYTLHLKNTILFIYFILLITYIFVYFFNMDIKSIYHKIKKVYIVLMESINKKRIKLIIITCLIMSVLSGLFIPTSLISDSPQEFKASFYLIFNDLSMSIGLFLFYPIFLYILSPIKIKTYISLLLCFIIPIILFNVFVMIGEYGNITPNLQFDNTESLLVNGNEIIFFIVFLFVYLLIYLFLIYKNKVNILYNIYFVFFVVLLLASILNIVKINNNTEKKEQQVLYEYENNFFRLSRTGTNVFIFVYDMALNSYWQDVFDNDTNYLKELDGFIFYPNTISSAPYTIGGITALLGGYEYIPYDMSTNGCYNITNYYDETLILMPMALKKYGYLSSYLNPFAINFSFNNDFSIFNTNDIRASYSYGSYSEAAEKKYLGWNINYDPIKKNKYNMIRFSIFRLLPIFLRYSFYDNGNWFNIRIEKRSDSAASYSKLLYVKDATSIEEKGNFYNIYHNHITHYPYDFSYSFLYNLYTNFHNDKNKFLSNYGSEFAMMCYYANMTALETLIDFIHFLKINNIYDNTKIIAVSDHALNMITKYTVTNEILSSFHALLMYKDFNNKGEMIINTNFMTIADTPYLALKHIPNIKNPFTKKNITNDYKLHNNIPLIYGNNAVQRQFSNRYNFNKFFTVKNNIYDINNWRKFEIDWKTKELKEVKIK